MILKYRQVTGPVNVVRTNPQEMIGKRISVRILMGPTGSGKSAFIESLSSEGTLSISKDSLDSVTQEVVCYRLINVVPTSLGNGSMETLIMDTPGFLDTKMSESKISKMIVSELDALRNCADYVAISVYYFLPITDIRMGSSKRDAFAFLRTFAESFKATRIHIITTMWNTIPSPKRVADANRRLDALQVDIRKQSGYLKVFVDKFYFNMESSLSIIDHPHCGWNQARQRIPKDLNPQFQSLALQNLIGRISSTQRQLEQLAEDRIVASIPGEENHRLLEVIDRQELAALAALRSFLDELYELDPGICSSPLHRNASSLLSSSRLKHLSLIPPSPLGAHQHSVPVNIPLPAQAAPVVPADIALAAIALQVSPSPVPAPPPTTLGSRFKNVIDLVGKLF